MNILKISFQYSTYNRKKKQNDLQQTNTLHVVISERYLPTCRLNRLERMNAFESIVLFSIILNGLLQMLPPVFSTSRTVLMRLAMYCYALLVPKNKCLFLRKLLSDLEA